MPAVHRLWVVAFLQAALLTVNAPALSAQTDRAPEVNPFIGTANGGNVFPGATMPFGMVQFSPEASPATPSA